jgi:hypothetical protein
MTNEELLERFKQLAAEQQKSHGTCPSCGRCPTCGRGGHQVAPWVIPMPYYEPYWWHQPTWTSPVTVTCSDNQPATYSVLSVTAGH